jgi:hypothetical protein
MDNTAVPNVDVNAPLAVGSDEEAVEVESETVTKSLVWFYGGSAITIVILLTAVGLGYFAQSSQKLTTPEPSPQVKVAQPVIVEEKKFDRAEWKVEVLNGSGKAGVAGEKAKALEKLGYTISKTGNADKRYPETVVFLSKEALPFKDEILQDFGVTRQEESTEEGVDIRVVMGST